MAETRPHESCYFAIFYQTVKGVTKPDLGCIQTRLIRLILDYNYKINVTIQTRC